MLDSSAIPTTADLDDWATRPMSDVQTVLTQAERDQAEINQSVETARNWSIQRDLARNVPKREVESVRPRPFRAAEMREVRSRHVSYGKLAMHGHLSVIGGDGGVGKSARVVTMALAKCTGRDLLGEGVHKRERVWWYSGEEDLEEMQRRVHAACLVHGINPDDLDDWLFLNSGKEFKLTVADMVKRRVERRHHVVFGITRFILENRIGLMIPDPLIQFHKCPENDNNAMDGVAEIFSHIAHDGRCAVLATQHFHKGSTPAGEADNFRGAIALINASRAAETLTVMSADEARRFGIDPVRKWRYVRIDDAKQNLFPPAEAARWIELVSADLHNGEDGRESDNVQSVKRWTPPDPMADLSTADEIYLLEAIAAGTDDGEQYTAASQAIGTDRYAGRVIEDLACKSKAEAQAMIRSWLRSKTLRQETYYSKARSEDRGCCVVDPDKLSDLRKILV